MAPPTLSSNSAPLPGIGAISTCIGLRGVFASFGRRNLPTRLFWMVGCQLRSPSRYFGLDAGVSQFYAATARHQTHTPFIEGQWHGFENGAFNKLTLSLWRGMGRLALSPRWG